MNRAFRSAALLALLLSLIVGGSGCAAYGLNYLDPMQPRCAGRFRETSTHRDESPGDDFTVVSYNIKYAKKIPQALATLERGGLSSADVLLLQEMDLPGTIKIAEALGYDYVYYPANHHPRVDKQFGLSILSPWPIREDHKLVLPRTGGRDVAGKIAVAATIWVKGAPVGVINVHMAARQAPVHLGDQLQILVEGCFALDRHQGDPRLDLGRLAGLAGRNAEQTCCLRDSVDLTEQDTLDAASRFDRQSACDSGLAHSSLPGDEEQGAAKDLI